MSDNRTKEQMEADWQNNQEARRKKEIEAFKEIIREHKGLTAKESVKLLFIEFQIIDPLQEFIASQNRRGDIEEPVGAILRAVSLKGRNRLRPINPDAPELGWRFRLADVIAWAERNEIGNTVLARGLVDSRALANIEDESEKTNGRAIKFSSDREQVLGAALSVLAAMPEACKNNAGEIVPTKIATQIEIKADYLFDEQVSPISQPVMARLIKEWLDRLGG